MTRFPKHRLHSADNRKQPLFRYLMAIMWKPKRLLFIALPFTFVLVFFAVYLFYPTTDNMFHNHHHHGHRHDFQHLRDEAKPGGGSSSSLLLLTHNNNDETRATGVNNVNNPRDRSSSHANNPLLKILVLTYKRAKSLARCLASLNAAEYDGERVALEIHIDRGKDGKVHNDTVQAAKDFVFKHGPVEVFVRPKHGGVVGQWLSSWQVPVAGNSSEVALFVEDDLTLSPYFARWLRRVHDKYDGYPNVNGYSLQAESILHAVGASGKLTGPAGHSVFGYPVLGSWGFSPNTGHWREFIRWYHEASQDPQFVPLVPGLKPSQWYQSFVTRGTTDTMWTMWHIFFADKHQEYTVYPNLPEKRGLAFNWKELGEHYKKAAKELQPHLLDAWREEDVRLPHKLTIVDAKGKTVGQKLSPLGLE